LRLNPKRPPGRANRKALQYAADIRELRQAGYPFSAIRQALLDAGISVSLSTVKREAARKDACAPCVPYPPQPSAAEQHPIPAAAVKDAAPDPRLDASSTLFSTTGKEIAKAFVASQGINLLFRQKPL
jgi:hypothetical protein